VIKRSFRVLDKLRSCISIGVFLSDYVEIKSVRSKRSTFKRKIENYPKNVIVSVKIRRYDSKNTAIS